MGDLIELDMMVKLISKVSPPFITVYTKLKSDGSNKATWYNNRYTYIVWDSNALTHGTNYLLRARLASGPAVGSFSNFTNIDLILDTVSSTSQTITATDEVLYISIGTDSGSSANNVELVMYACNIFSNNGNYRNNFTNAEVVNKFLMQNMTNLYSNFTINPTPSELA
jgi:uncharacterized protein YodC (DUF2158 family)